MAKVAEIVDRATKKDAVLLDDPVDSLRSRVIQGSLVGNRCATEEKRSVYQIAVSSGASRRAVRSSAMAASRFPCRM